MTYLYGTEPMPWQRRGFDQGAEHITHADFMDPGMGKTKLELDVAANAYLKGEIDLLIALAPNGVHRVWPQEAAIHLHHVPHKAAFYRAGTSNRAIKEVMAAKDCLRIVSLNVESMSHGSGRDALNELLGMGKADLVVDESQKIRTPGAKRTRFLWKAGEQAVMRRITTGTSVIKGLHNLYAQYRFLHPGIIGCKTYTDFKAKYCIMVGPYNQIVGFKNQEELMALVGRRTFLAYESEMNLPEPVVSRRPVELSPEQKRVYNDLKETFLAELASGALVEAPLAISRYQKFQQILGGHVRVEDGTWEPLPCPRLESAVDVVEAAPSKILVWAEWQPDILQLGDALRKADIPHVTYFGGNSERQNAKNLDHFRDSTDCHAFVATRASGGAGLTINEAKRTLNYTHSYNTEYVWQSRKRNHRLGQDKVIHVTDLYAPGTIDSKILASNAKDEDVASIMRNPALFAQWLTDQTED